MCKITKALETISDKNNPQDQKILLLVKLVEDKFKHTDNKIEQLSSNVEKLTEVVKETLDERKTCPIYKLSTKEKNNVETFFLLIKRPKILLLIALGSLSFASIGVKELVMEIIKLIVK